MNIVTDEREELQRVALLLYRRLDFSAKRVEVQRLATELGVRELSLRDIARVRALAVRMRTALVEQLSVKLGQGKDLEPRLAYIAAELEKAGFPKSRPVILAVRDAMRARYGERWKSLPGETVRVKVSVAEQEYFEALKRTYGMQPMEVMSLLIRSFALATATNRIDFVGLPKTAIEMSDEDLRQFARALKFKINLRA